MHYYFRVDGSDLGDEIYVRTSCDIDINSLDEDKRNEFIEDGKKQVTAFGGGTATLITEDEYIENTEED